MDAATGKLMQDLQPVMRFRSIAHPKVKTLQCETNLHNLSCNGSNDSHPTIWHPCEINNTNSGHTFLYTDVSYIHLTATHYSLYTLQMLTSACTSHLL